MAKKTKADLYLDCPCGAKSPVFQGKDSKWFSQESENLYSPPVLTQFEFSGEKYPFGSEEEMSSIQQD